MTSTPYPVLGLKVPTLRGRKRALDEVIRHLIKSTPDHVSVIGPKLVGKTVLLHGLKDYFSKEGSPYAATLYWDMRHGSPSTDKEFYRAFAGRLRQALQAVDPELAAMLGEGEEKIQSDLSSAFELLRDESKKVLVILDGFDELLHATGITGNLWDYLLSLAQYPSLCFVTGSRRRLRELCASPESRTSDFWNIFFDTPITLGPFDEEDWTDFLGPFSEQGVTIDSSAKKELGNWTGGIPVLAAALASLCLKSGRTSISKAEVDQTAEEVLNAYQDHLDTLWDDCSAEEQGDLVDLAQKGGFSLSEIPAPRRDSLVLRGYAASTGNKLRLACRLMEKHAVLRGENLSDLRRVFGSVDRYERNIQAFLELRLAQVKNADSELKGYIEKAVRDLLPESKHSIVWMRSIAERALDLIWEKELPTKEVPREWTESWKQDERDPPAGLIPSERRKQIYLLRLMGDSKKAGNTRVSRPSYLLLEYIHSVGNFGQHTEGQSVSLQFGAVTCFSAIELYEQLAKELKN